MVTETKRPKPSTINVADELGFSQQRLPETGPGLHKPNLGRGGLPLPSDYYLPDNDLVVPQKKGVGTAARVPSDKMKNTDSKPKWSDII